VTERVPPRITFISKPGCHLCGPAREVVERVAGDLGVQWVERSILDDPDLFAAYREQIPVTLVDGALHDHWRVDESRLRRALENGGASEVPGQGSSEPGARDGVLPGREAQVRKALP
jgi:hypothetical protein